MSQGGDYLYYRTNTGKEASISTTFVATGATGVTLITVTGTTRQVHVQRITLIPTTFAAGTLTFGETASGTGVFATLVQPSAAFTPTGAAVNFGGPQSLSLEFGAKGYALAAGANLFMVRSATGSAGTLLVEAYETTSGTVALGSTN